ncbi:MAG: UDP-3-O-acyl-N-acetylglucosamine deacetylase [Clostridium sp.]|nr:UDP-3-O-acyl-N-acetylglucosamine deacetylase [Bacteroides sp.]MCM1198237.1 UDP-3-O-acyl-N-acetylglucosamine deacetylase [Clostridium sp.]
MVQQHTVRKEFCFEGKGLHTGKVARMTIKPAPVDFGIRFLRTDVSGDAIVEAVADNVSNTARSTTITKDGISVITVEHIMSALTGMGIDNALVEIDNVEVPILDGSAKPYIDAIWKSGIAEQDAPRRYLEIKEPFEIRNEETGAYLKIEPADEPSYDLTIDFNSRVLGVQTAHWDPKVVYAEEIGICRTFVFFHEIEFLFKNNLIKGGDVDNAIVIVEHPVTDAQLEHMSRLFNVPFLGISDEGYLNNLQLRFPNECARHKLLDLIGDLRLSGGFLKARITAYKSGHSINTRAARELGALLKQK